MSPRDDLFALAADYAKRFEESLNTRRVGADASFDDVRAALGGPLPDEGGEDAAVLHELIAGAEPGIVGSQTGRYFGFVFGSALPAAVAADWMATAWDQNGFSVVTSPAAAAAEAVAGEWPMPVAIRVHVGVAAIPFVVRYTNPELPVMRIVESENAWKSVAKLGISRSRHVTPPSCVAIAPVPLTFQAMSVSASNDRIAPRLPSVSPDACPVQVAPPSLVK